MGVREELIAELQRTIEAMAETADSAARQRVARMSEISDELIERAAALADQLERLSEAVAEAARSYRRELGLAELPELEPLAIRQQASLDEIEQARAEIERSRTPLLPRFRPGSDVVPEGVRIVVIQMRMAGESEGEIVRRLEEMGVEDPASVIAQVESL